MAKIVLSIDKNYCNTWNAWSGIRELLQNAKDAEDYESKRMEVNHFAKTNRLEITTRDVYVSPANLLILGKTSKGAGNQRGKFGEGFVLGVLALVRQGCDVKFRNGDLSWTVAFEPPDAGHPLEGNEMMVFKSRALAAREPDFRLEIEGISLEAWNIIKSNVLFIDEPKAAEILTTPDGTLLLNPLYKGKVFVHGLYVRTFDDLSIGYDLKKVTLDRDRQMIDEWQLHYTLGRLWQSATALAPDLAAPRVYEMAKADSPDTRNLHYHADAQLLQNLRKQYEAEHGVDTIPVSTNAEVREAESAGGKPTMVSGVLKSLLEKSGLSLETSKKRLEGVVERRWLPAELAAFPTASANLQRLEAVLPSVAVVTFRGNRAGCFLLDEKAVVGVDRRLLDEPFQVLLQTAVTVEAQRLGITALDVLLAHVAGDRLDLPRAPEAPPEN